VHFLERYLRAPLAARVYLRVQDHGGLGLPGYDVNDDAWPAETMVLFDGLLTDVSPRAGAADSTFTINLAHFLAVLTHSSATASQVAPGTAFPVAFNVAAAPTILAGGVRLTGGFGAGTLAVAGGLGLETDFWGYHVELGAGIVANGVRGYGIKGFLDTLAGFDLVNWAALQQGAALGATNCVGNQPVRNDQAADALDRIEPFNYRTADWKTLRQASAAFQAGGQAVYRGKYNGTAAGKAAYVGAGFRYGVPVAFFQGQLAQGGLGIGNGFASSLVYMSRQATYQGTFWDILVGHCVPEFQVALAAYATGAVVMPFNPILPFTNRWQTIHSNEIEEWGADFSDPVPVRGVALVSRTRSKTGLFQGGIDITSPETLARFQQVDAVFDSCTKGAFVFRDTPTWMAAAQALPAVHAPATLTRPRPLSSVPWTMAPLARLAAEDTLGLATGIAAVGGGAAAAAVGFKLDALTAPTPSLRSVAYRHARALYQQSRLQHRSLYVRGRLRVDIAPGSTVHLEVPADKFVRDAVGANRDTRMCGVVLRMTITVDAERNEASTAFQVGFVRTESEGVERPDNPLHSNSHPYWATACLGLPWCDTAAVRAKLGDGSTIDPTLAGAALGAAAGGVATLTGQPPGPQGGTSELVGG
jgi:hypothetical protein